MVKHTTRWPEAAMMLAAGLLLSLASCDAAGPVEAPDAGAVATADDVGADAAGGDMGAAAARDTGPCVKST